MSDDKWDNEYGISYDQCLDSAYELILRGYSVGPVSVDELAEMLFKLELEKAEKDAKSDAKLDYNDEIMEIEDLGEMETVDISVSGDNLFYCNGILTKNSFGVPATADFFFALMTNDDFEQKGQLLVKLLKNRLGALDNPRRFLIGCDRPKMRLYDLEPSAQTDLMGGPTDIPLMDKTTSGGKPNFGGFV